MAYYPYDATLSGTTYKVNVSDQSEPAKIDLMRADNLRGLSLTNRTARLDFDHELATLTLRLTATDGTVLNGLTATLEDVATQADFDLTTGAFSTRTATADVAMLVTTESTTSATATALLIPGTYAEGLKVTLRLGDKVQTVAPSLTQLARTTPSTSTSREAAAPPQEKPPTSNAPRRPSSPTRSSNRTTSTTSYT